MEARLNMVANDGAVDPCIEPAEPGHIRASSASHVSLRIHRVQKRGCPGGAGPVKRAPSPRISWPARTRAVTSLVQGLGFRV